MSDKQKTYRVNEVFYSLQGEGVRAGTPNVFIRMTGCNLQCKMEPGPISPGGFDCDTEFTSGRKVTADELLHWILEVLKEAGKPWPRPGIIFTGGEPALQVDKALVDFLRGRGFCPICIETNGSKNVDDVGFDWITVSPKVAEHAIRQRTANELKYVRAYKQDIPVTSVKADNYLISPAFDGMELSQRNLQWCVYLVKTYPRWRLSAQIHKFWGVR